MQGSTIQTLRALRKSTWLQAVPIACLFLLGAVPLAQAQDVPGCGSLRNAYGPFDYQDPVSRRDKLPVVEAYHFTPEVEALRAGKSSSIIGDLDYTLRAFPNHPRALNSVARYVLSGQRIPDGQYYSVECYFTRALAINSNDATVRLLFGNYLFRHGDRKQAKEHYEEALRLAPDSAEISYNVALYLVDAGELDQARTLAAKIYEKGYPLQGLKKKLAAAEAKAASKGTSKSAAKAGR